MDPFIYNAAPGRVVFGHGTIAQTGAEMERLGVKRALVLTTPQQAADGQRLADMLGGKSAGTYAKAAMHTPFEITEEAMQLAQSLRIDCTIALGGGSTTGLGKAIAFRTDLPQIVIPTTYAGSEMTDILGETKQGLKTTVRDAKILPEVVIYDVDLTLGLPVGLSATSGMNAIAHAVEAVYAKDKNPVITLMSDSTVLPWRAVAKDGASLPAALAVPGPGRVRMSPGETFDVEFTPARGRPLALHVKSFNSFDVPIRIR